MQRDLKDGVIMLVNEYPPLPVGGAERQAERLAEHLARRGWPVWVLTRRIGSLPIAETRNNVHIVRPITAGPGKLQTISFVLGCWQMLWKLRKDYKILHAHLAFGPAFAAVFAARLLNKRVIVKFGNSGKFGDIATSMSTARGRLRIAILRRWADVVIALDDIMRAEIVAAGFDEKRIVRMNNGIDSAAFSPATEANATSELTAARVNVLYVGRLTGQKSLTVILQALAKALPHCPALRLTLVGSGEERPVLEAEAEKLDITSSINFAGSQADVRPYLNQADIFVLPSASEGISNALLEAMSMGLACLAAPVGGNVEVLDQGRCGVILPQGDIDAWSKTLVALGINPHERARLGQAARERIQHVYDFAVVGAQYEALYKQLLGAET